MAGVTPNDALRLNMEELYAENIAWAADKLLDVNSPYESCF